MDRSPRPWWCADESDVLSLPTFTWSSSSQTWLILTQEVTLTHREGCPSWGWSEARRGRSITAPLVEEWVHSRYTNVLSPWRPLS